MSDKFKPSTINSLLTDTDSIIASLYSHCVYLSDLENKLLKFLSLPLAEHCNVANYTNDTIILFCDSPTWAAKLRYNTPAILEYLKSECHLQSIKTVRIKVKPPVSPFRSGSERKLSLSPSSVAFIRQVINTTTDEELRLSLLKIASHNK